MGWNSLGSFISGKGPRVRSVKLKFTVLSSFISSHLFVYQWHWFTTSCQSLFTLMGLFFQWKNLHLLIRTLAGSGLVSLLYKVRPAVTSYNLMIDHLVLSFSNFWIIQPVVAIFKLLIAGSHFPFLIYEPAVPPHLFIQTECTCLRYALLCSLTWYCLIR